MVGVAIVTLVSVDAVAPKLIDVEPIVMFELVSEPLPMFVIVFVEPDMDLFVNVSVVARPTKVSVDVGNVNVPVLLIVLIIGLVSVLFVKVCVPVNVTTVESIAIVTGEEPLKLVPDNPVPIVNALGVFAVIVALPPSDIADPFIVIELFVNPEFGIVALI
jgi:hypothetical protein